MFKGLDEENESDLDSARLNAYRSHFGLSSYEAEKDDTKFEIFDHQVVSEEVMEEIIQPELEEILEEVKKIILLKVLKFFKKFLFFKKKNFEFFTKKNKF